MTTKRRNCKVLVLEALRAQNMQTIAELAAATKLSKEGVRDALLRLISEGYAHRMKEVRKYANFQSHIYALGHGEPVEEVEEPMMHVRERQKAILETMKTVNAARAAYTPGAFDPFRVLRAQVGA